MSKRNSRHLYQKLMNTNKLNVRYGYHQRENTSSCLFTEVKPSWTGLITGWVTIQIKYPVLYSLGSQAGVVDINYAFHLYYICCMWIEFQLIST